VLRSRFSGHRSILELRCAVTRNRYITFSSPGLEQTASHAFPSRDSSVWEPNSSRSPKEIRKPCQKAFFRFSDLECDPPLSPPADPVLIESHRSLERLSGKFMHRLRDLGKSSVFSRTRRIHNGGIEGLRKCGLSVLYAAV